MHTYRALRVWLVAASPCTDERYPPYTLTCFRGESCPVEPVLAAARVRRLAKLQAAVMLYTGALQVVVCSCTLGPGTGATAAKGGNCPSPIRRVERPQSHCGNHSTRAYFQIKSNTQNPESLFFT
jgi:hypothetical protein